MMSGMIECSVCHSKIVNPSTKTVARAYDRHRSKISAKQRAVNFLLVGGDCVLVGFQPILVYMSKVDGRFKFSPISVNFLTEVAKVIFAITMLLFQATKQKVGEKPLLSLSTFMQAARNNKLLAVPALLYAINNYLKFTMQLYFNPATVKMLSNLKSVMPSLCSYTQLVRHHLLLYYSYGWTSLLLMQVLVIAVLLKFIMKRRFSIIQWEALALLLIGISINQLRSMPEGTTALSLPITTGVTVPSMASVFNEYALKSQFDTSIYLQNLFLYGYGAIFNFLGILGTVMFTGPSNFNILEGHSKATMFLICNNAAQGILSSFFFKYADTILKKYSSTVATIFTGIASAALFGHTLTINFLLGISVVFISMHQFFSPLAKAKDEEQNGVVERTDVLDKQRVFSFNLFVPSGLRGWGWGYCPPVRGNVGGVVNTLAYCAQYLMINPCITIPESISRGQGIHRSLIWLLELMMRLVTLLDMMKDNLFFPLEGAIAAIPLAILTQLMESTEKKIMRC
ncbi:CMP-sialic acid transporter 3 [Orobanche gracilis]